MIIDFYPPYNYKNIYHHCDGVFSFKMNYSNMFIWHPSYTLIETTSFSHNSDMFDISPDERLALSIIYKEHEPQIPQTPYAR